MANASGFVVLPSKDRMPDAQLKEEIDRMDKAVAIAIKAKKAGEPQENDEEIEEKALDD